MHADLADAALGEVGNTEQRLALAARRIGHSGDLNLEDALALSLSDFAPERRGAFYALGAFAPLPARFDWEAARAVAQCDGKTISIFVDRNLVERDKATNPLAELALHQSFSELARRHPQGDAGAAAPRPLPCLLARTQERLAVHRRLALADRRRLGKAAG